MTDQKQQTYQIESLFDASEGEGKVLCPICKDDYAHFNGEPQFTDGKDSYAADWWGRGDLLRIPVWGECGHTWDICFGFHKGQMFAFAEESGRSHPHDSEVSN